MNETVAKRLRQLGTKPRPPIFGHSIVFAPYATITINGLASQKSDIGSQLSAPRSSLGPKLLTPVRTQNFHLLAERDHSR
jgi:hypothetical protein